jgi:hypothetical protein
MPLRCGWEKVSGRLKRTEKSGERNKLSEIY